MLKLKKPSRLEWIILAVIGVAATGLGLWWIISSVIDSQTTYPLGDKLEYIGKESSNCPVGPTLDGFNFGFCDKTSFYYYATDMDSDEVNAYFHNTHVESMMGDGDQVGGPVWSAMNGLNTHGSYLLINGGNYTFWVNYTDNIDAISKKMPIKKTSKKRVVRILSSDYKYILQYAL